VVQVRDGGAEPAKKTERTVKDQAKRLYEVDWWLKSVPQGYLLGTDYGIDNTPDNPLLHDDQDLREATINQLAHLAYVEWITLDTVAGLIPICPERDQKTCLSTQVIDEARHIEIYEHRLYEFGIKPEEKDRVIESAVNPNLKIFRALTNDLLAKKDYVAAIFCQHIVLEGIAFTVFEVTRRPGRTLDPRTSRLIDYVMIDESRHLGFGEHQMRQLLVEHAHRKKDLEKVGAETMHYVSSYFWEWTYEHWRQVRKVAEYPAVRDVFVYEGKRVEDVDPTYAADMIAAKLKVDLQKRMSRLGLEYEYQAPTELTALLDRKSMWSQ
jgi:hypothetical protein